MPEHEDAPASSPLSEEPLRTLGLLVRRVSYDLNNLLTPVSAWSEMLRAKMKPDSQEYRILARIEHSAIRAAEFVQKLNAYAHSNERRREGVHLNGVVEDTSQALTALLESADRLELALSPSLPAVNGVREDLGLVLMLLATNAAEAIENDPEGRMTITTGLAVPHEDGMHLLTYDSAIDGEAAFLEVRDNGPGLQTDPHDASSNLFHSTKGSTDSPRGLGLPAVCEVARDHQGAVKIGSNNEQPGAVVRVYLPIAAGAGEMLKAKR